MKKREICTKNTYPRGAPDIHTGFFLVAYCIIFDTGLAVLSTGAILPDIIREFNINYDMAGLFLSLQAIGNMSSTAVIGYLSEFIGRKAMLLSGSLMIAAGFLGLAFAPSSKILFVLIFVSGCGWGINNIISGIINDITGASASHLGRLHIFFAAGALAAPFLSIFAGAAGMGWRHVCGMIGLMALCAAVLLTFIKIPKAKKQKIGTSVSFKAFAHARYYIFLAIAFTYTAVETAMNGWITTYFQATGILGEFQAKTALSMVWASIMAGRIIMSIVGDKIKKEHMILVCSIAVLAFSAIFIQLSSFAAILACIFALGLGLSAVIPTNIANSEIVVQGSGAALGVLLSFGGLGAAAGPLVTGIAAKHMGLSASMWVSVGFAFVLLVMALINFLCANLKKKEGKKS